MPFFKNRQEQKEQFINDIGNMITGNSVFKREVKNDDYLKAFNNAKAYFDKQKSPEAKQLAGYIQNFINVYNNQNLAKNEVNDEHSYNMITDIESLGSGFTDAYNKYIQANKYTALRNSNVKLLSAMVQTAENMKHRVEMEDREETMDFVNNELNLEKKIMAGTLTEYSEFINDCVNDGVNFVEPEEELKEYQKKHDESKGICDKIKNTLDEIAKGSDSKQDLLEAEECRNKLLEHARKITAAENKIQKLSELKTSLTVFRAESQAVDEQINSYLTDIEMDRAYIDQANKEIAENQAKVSEGEKVQKRFDELKEQQIMFEYGMAETSLNNFEEDRKALSDMSSGNLNVKDLIGKKDPSPIEKIALMQYESVKGRMCEAIPGIEAGFKKLESTSGYNISSLFTEYNDQILDALDERERNLSEIKNSTEYKEYQELSAKVSVADASRNNIKALNNKITGYKEDIQKKEELIAATKIKGGLGDKIAEALGHKPEGPVTERSLIQAMNNEIISTRNEIQNLKNSPEPEMLNNKMKAAEQRAKDKDIVQLNKKLTSESVKFNKLKEKLDKIKEYVKTHLRLKEKTDKLFDKRQIVHKDNSNLKKLNPNQEIYDRLNAIKERFNQKSNGKMNVDCQNMMNQLDDAISKFDPKNEDNVFNHEEQIKSLEKLQELSGKYQDAMAAKHIPKWLASEQRLLRISCAEEMESFSAVAKGMVQNVKQNDVSYERALRYADTPVDEHLKQRLNDRAVTNAAIKVKQQQRCMDYQAGRDKRQNAPTISEVQEVQHQADAKLI